MKPNVFMISPRLGSEDRLTIFWEWVLDAIPSLGQAFVDHVTRRSGLQSSKFLGAIRNPKIDAKNHPDFMIKCSNFDIFFEHKLDAAFGRRQLERYLGIMKADNQYLSVVAAQRMEIPHAVIDSPRYISPREMGAANHYLWQDIHHIMRSCRGRIARDFSDYLKHLELAKFSWHGLGDPFTDIDAADSLRDLYREMTPCFRKPGVICRTILYDLLYCA